MCTMTVEEPPVKSEPSEKSVKTKLKQYRQKLMTIKARIRYREHAIKGFRKHLKNGTFPQRIKSIKAYPKMSSPETQNIVNAAFDQVQCVILDQMIQRNKRNSLKIKTAIKRSWFNDKGIDSSSRNPKNLRNPPWLNSSKN